VYLWQDTALPSYIVYLSGIDFDHFTRLLFLF